MKAGFGFIALFLALVIVGVLMFKQLSAPTPPGLAGTTAGSLPGAAPAATGTAVSRASQLQNEAREGVAKAMTEAQTRREQAEKP